MYTKTETEKYILYEIVYMIHCYHSVFQLFHYIITCFGGGGLGGGDLMCKASRFAYSGSS